MKFRVSLRGLLVVFALFAAFCYWRGRPRQIADRFVAAVKAKDQVALRHLIADSPSYERLIKSLRNRATKTQASRRDQRFIDWLQGRCGVYFVIDSPGNLVDFYGTGVASSTSVELRRVFAHGGLLWR